MIFINDIDRYIYDNWFKKYKSQYRNLKSIKSHESLVKQSPYEIYEIYVWVCGVKYYNKALVTFNWGNGPIDIVNSDIKIINKQYLNVIWECLQYKYDCIDQLKERIIM